VWHVALVGLGYYPNAHGLEANDGAIFDLTRGKYGVRLLLEDYEAEDRAAKQHFFGIWQQDKAFVIRSFLGRLGESVTGRTKSSGPAFQFLSNVTYRICCLLGFVAMVIRGGDRRLLGIAAAGTYTIYVVLTCIFYFVGLAYDNVSQVTLFVLFMGGLDSLLFFGRRATGGLSTFDYPARLTRCAERRPRA